MSFVVCTLVEGHYHYGVAALVNSLYKQGFRGDFYAGCRGDLPFWAKEAKENNSLQWANARTLEVEKDLLVHFLPLYNDFHLTNYKPNFMLDLLDGPAKQADGIVYFDPDIVVKMNWEYFKKWLGFGVALVHEITSNDMPASHPVRKMWEGVIEKADRKVTYQLTSYINGGFCGVSKANREFLETWKLIMNTGFDYFKMTPQQFKHDYDRSYEFFGQDQDALNIAAMCCTSPLSESGPEAMDFIYGGNVMSHALGSPKPWKKNFLLFAFKGLSPSLADRGYWKNADGIIKTYPSNTLKYKKITITIAAFIGRFYRKY